MAATLTALLAILSYVSAMPHQKRSSTGPVISSNFQDPSVIDVDGTYYAYSGPNGNPPVHVQLATSSDFENWQLVPGYDVLPTVGSWAASTPRVWAPDVVQLDDGQFVLYYAAATAQDSGKHCVGAATASQPQGPFTAIDNPLFCDLSVGGAIDPNGFKDPQSGNQYVVYKVDGNSIGNGGACSNSVPPIQSTPLILQQVSSVDGTSATGSAIEILSNIEEDGPMIEAPALIYDPGSATYILFYNSGCFTSSNYNIKYATSSSVSGPYTRQGTFLATGSTAANIYIPGGIDVVNGGSKAVLHGDINQGWFAGDGSKRVRAMYAIDVNLSGGSATPGSLL